LPLSPSVRAAAETLSQAESRLDILMNNAGIMMTPEGLTKEGYKIQFGTNVMGPALFTHCLLPILQKTAKINPQTRVVMLSSASERMAPKDAYKFEELKTTMSDRNTTARYCLSKLADIHWTTGMAGRHPDVKLISVHPGMVATNLHHASAGTFLRPFLYTAVNLFATPVEKGALSQIWAAVSPDARTGEFYGPVGVAGKGSARSKDRELQGRLFTWVEKELEGQRL
jgi:NAD(P)-dependent dehydrogenase (short-subunit alcohol dehydrogenase family)